jgi:leucyl-tRNA synthetase
MEFSNSISDIKIEPSEATPEEAYAVREALTSLILMLTPFSPHTAEELYAELIGNDRGMLANGARFPESDEELAKADEIEIAVQINGKLRSRVIASPEASNDELKALAFDDEKVKEQTAGKEIVKVIVIPQRLVNIVIR